MRWAVAHGHRADDPAGPAVLQALPKGEGSARRHHRALPHAEVAGAIARAKARIEHRVPLSPRCLATLAEAWDDLPRTGAAADLVFPSARGRQLAYSALSRLLRDCGVEAVSHGFHSSFRDWASECTDAPRAVMEAALAPRSGTGPKPPTRGATCSPGGAS